MERHILFLLPAFCVKAYRDKLSCLFERYEKDEVVYDKDAHAFVFIFSPAHSMYWTTLWETLGRLHGKACLSPADLVHRERLSKAFPNPF